MSTLADTKLQTKDREDVETSSVEDARSWRKSESCSPAEIPVTRDLFGRKKLPKIPRGQLVNITSQLAIMTRSGVDIVSALDSLARQSPREETQQILMSIHDSVSGGMPFSVALRQYENVFGPSFVASVSAGEASGEMWEVLSHLAQLMRGDLKMRTTLRAMAMYPIVLTSVSMVVIAALVFFVLPQFAKVFADFGTPLPWITRALLAVSNELSTRWWLWVPGFAGAVVSGISFLKTSSGRRIYDHVVLNTRVLSGVTQTLMIGRICRLLGLLLKSGVPLLESLSLVRDSIGNSYYRQVFDELEQNVISGRGLGTTLIDSQFIPSSAAEMVMTAERTGTLEDVTQLIGEHYEEEGGEKLRGLISVLEPAITVGMGVIVSIVVLSVALPMFDLATFAGK